MNISLQEKLMYDVMKALYDSAIPISFKGSMVLKACLYEAGYYDDTRHTVDIDANWNSDEAPTTDEIAQSISNAIEKSGINLKANAYRTYSKTRSAGIEIRDSQSDEMIFTMDIDVNRPIAKTKIYEISGMSFKGVAPAQIIADKVSVISTEKVFRRIKDLVDLYYLSHVINFEPREIFKILENSERSLGNFEAFLYKQEEIKHSYDKFIFAGGVNKPDFDQVYQAVKEYVAELIR